MSPAEYLELIQMSGDSAGMHGMNGVSILFAYVITAHFVGAKFSRVQIVVINMIYSIFLTIPVLSCLQSINLGALHIERLVLEHLEIAAHYGFSAENYPSAYFLYANSVLWVSAWIFSLVFMHNARKQG